jgi:hypothetical protein
MEVQVPGQRRSAAPSIDATVTAAEDSGAADVVTSCLLADEDGTKPPSTGTFTTSSPPEPAPSDSANAVWRAAVSSTARSSSTTMAATGGGGAADFSTTVATASPSSTCTGSGSVYGGWGQGSDSTTCALKAKRFRGVRLRTLVTVCLREDETKLPSKTN